MALNIDRWMAQGMSMALARELRANLGGRITVDLTDGDHIVTVPDECQNLRHILTGTPSGVRNYVFPLLSGFYFVDVQASSAFDINLQVMSGGSLTVTNGQKLIVLVDEQLGTIENFGSGGSGPGAGGQVSIDFQSSPYVVSAAYDTIYVDTVANNPLDQPLSVVLPDASGNAMREITVIGKTASGVINLTSVGGLMNNMALWPINMIFGVGNAITFKSDSVNWWSK